MITTMKGFKETVDTVKSLMEEQRKVALDIRPVDQKWPGTLDAQVSKLDSNEFRVLVMGVFTSGKSSFLNAVLGQKVLPTKMLPTTSVITEIRYGENKKVVVHPKPGCWEAGDQPFEVAPGELGKYCTIDNRKGLNKREKSEVGRDILESPFRKVEVFWPIPILKDGVVLIDSPGLDDPDCRDDIVHDYIPTAGAIIYLVGAKGLSGMDAQELARLNNLGFCQLIIGVTHFDEALQTFFSEEEREEYMEVNRAQNSKFTQLGEEGIFFLSSLDGLKAKLTGDSKLLQESGYMDMEKYLESYLVENRAVSQLDSVVGEMRNLNKEMTSAAEKIALDADNDMETLRLRIEVAGSKLGELREKRDRILEGFKRELSPVEGYICEETEKFLEEMPNSLSMESFEPMTVIPGGLERLMHPGKVRAAAKSMAEEAAEFLRQECEARTSEWYRDTLMPGVYGIVKKAADSLGQSFDEYQRDLNSIEDTLKGVKVERKERDSAFGGAVYGVLVGLATGGWGIGLLGPIYGSSTLNRVVVAQAAVGVALGLASAVFPVTWGALILAALIASFLAMITGGESQVKQIKKDAVKSIKKAYEKKETRKQVSDTVFEQTMKLVNDFTAALGKAFQDDFDVAEGEIEDKRNTALMNASERAEKKRKMEEAIAHIETLNTKIAGIVSQYMNV